MKTIILDAGHGLKTAGKRCMKSLDPNQTREWFLNQRVAGYVETYLRQYGFNVIRVDDRTGLTDVPLSKRVSIANATSKTAIVPFYVSIHHNAGANGSTSGGICVFHSSTKVERMNHAKALYNELISHTGLKGNRSTPVAYQSLYVCKNTSMPALLCELGFMDSSIDIHEILTEEYAKKCGLAIADLIKNL